MKILLAAAVLLTGSVDAGAPVVTTDAGAVRGKVSGDVRIFSGIRYATAGRWEAPKPAAPWKGVKDATKPGSPCPQVGADYANVTSENEDCLFLNVTTPARPGTKRPVMVWIHGDGAVGAGHFSDPRRLAREGGAVVVTINYRLGVFGGFGYPGLRNSGTFGLQDQQEALRWVRRNAAAFGGDPGNVTVFGVSYGASAIGGHLTSPGAKGLFHKAALQSGEAMMDMPAGSILPGLPAAPYLLWRSTAEVEETGKAFAAQLGCADLDCLRKLPVKKILAVPQIMNAFQGLAYGNEVLPEVPAKAIAAGRFHPVPVLAGATKDEHRLFAAMRGKISYPDALKETFGERAGAVAKEYPLERYGHPAVAWSAVMTDRLWAVATHAQNTALARRAPVYGYEFADRDAPMFLPVPADFDLGAYHAGDLPYLFPGKKEKLSPAQWKLSGQMVAYWTNFARTGDPNGTGLPAWPRLGKGGTLSLEPGKIRPIDYAAEHRLDFWN
ncbi:carboxylesterase/lipase family protein [Nonomuraea typhae]|uniref:carboxylesterase/lipase family protein n=1 Tax=Nonomuraea typhae TaxID=2603600 RepID=UPI0012F94819|nr:carboxylesterase family protein [Nonomuraea typhae]